MTTEELKTLCILIQALEFNSRMLDLNSQLIAASMKDGGRTYEKLRMAIDKNIDDYNKAKKEIRDK